MCKVFGMGLVRRLGYIFSLGMGYGWGLVEGYRVYSWVKGYSWGLLTPVIFTIFGPYLINTLSNMH